MNISVTKVGNDNTSVVLTSATPGYEYLDGKNAFGTHPLITTQQMQEMSIEDFDARVLA